MTNGTAYVLDEHGVFPERINPEMIRLARPDNAQDIATLHRVIEHHYKATGSCRAAEVLDRWHTLLPLFWQVIPLPAETIAKTVEVAKQESAMTPAPSQ